MAIWGKNLKINLKLISIILIRELIHTNKKLLKLVNWLKIIKKEWKRFKSNFGEKLKQFTGKNKKGW